MPDTLSTCILVSTTVPVVVFGAQPSEATRIKSMVISNSSGTATQFDLFDRNTAGSHLFGVFIAASGGGASVNPAFPILGNSNSTVVARVTPTVKSVILSAHGITYNG